MITIQEQTWQSLTRVLLMHEHGSCQLELYREPKGDRKVTAYIFALWVDPEHRREGIAKRLIETVEEIARRKGEKEIWLEWCENDAVWPDKNYALDIFKWYESIGYDEVEFGRRCSLMRKRL